MEYRVMAKKPPGHSPSIESLAGKTLQSDTAGKTAKRLAAAVLAHADGKPAPKPAPNKKGR